MRVVSLSYKFLTKAEDYIAHVVRHDKRHHDEKGCADVCVCVFFLFLALHSTGRICIKRKKSYLDLKEPWKKKET